MAKAWKRGEKALSVTRSKLIERIASANGLADRDAATALTAVIDAIAQGLQDGERVEVRGFGVFNPRTLPARRARNPRTGESVQVHSRKTVQFKAGRKLARSLIDDDQEPAQPSETEGSGDAVPLAIKRAS